MPGVVWAGTDDGNLQVSRDGGLTFTEVGENISGLPRARSLETTRSGSHESTRRTSTLARRTSRSTGTAAMTLHPYVFVTRDYGTDLPEHRQRSAERTATCR